MLGVVGVGEEHPQGSNPDDQGYARKNRPEGHHSSLGDKEEGYEQPDYRQKDSGKVSRFKVSIHCHWPISHLGRQGPSLAFLCSKKPHTEVWGLSVGPTGIEPMTSTV